MPLPTESDVKLRANPHGVRMGWFAWPYNFDPVWLLECSGFTPKVPAHDAAIAKESEPQKGGV